MSTSVYKFFLLILIIPSLAYAQLQQGRVMQFLGRFNTGLYNQGGAEVVAYDASRTRLFLSGAVGQRVTALDITNPSAPIRLFDISLAPYGGTVNSIAVSGNTLAVAIEDIVPQNPGRVIFFTTDGQFISQVTVGALPDMLVFSPDGRYVLTANEGEPSADYINDPEGSVSIINLSNGVANASVSTASFAPFNNRRDSLQLIGIRITGLNNPTVAQDMEPEYITITPDSRTAYVTLQENNAIATIDIATATVRELLPLTQTDYRMGLPRMRSFPFTPRPLLGTTAGGQNILMGGLSGLFFEGINPTTGNWRFIANTDRGPNAAVSTVRGLRGRPFALPNYQVRCIRFEMNPQTGAISLTQTIPLTRNNGATPLTGLPNLQAGVQNTTFTDEIPIDLNGNQIANDPFGADLEGIVVAPNGELWLCDEYRPAIYRFTPQGDLIRRYIPVGTSASVNQPIGTYGTEVLPAVYAARRPNRGFEAIALDGTKLYTFIQSPIDNPNSSSNTISRTSSILRILEFDVVTEQVTGEYLMPMFESTNTVENNKVDKIGDAVALGNGRFMLVERDSRVGAGAKKLVYEINLRGATNLVTNPLMLNANETPENLGIAGLVQRGVRLVAKRKVTNLAGLGYALDKVEGLARVDSTTFVVINDNDFGMNDEVITGNGLASIQPDGGEIRVGVLSFDIPNGLDDSDRDGAGNTASIAIRQVSVPAFATQQPDAIGNYTFGGQTFLVTANEGDVREYGSFVETRRVNDPLLLLDPVAFPASANVRADANLGRLNVFRTTGDIDGDGDIDELNLQGGRSFSIYSSDGSLIFDSGEQFERITSQISPTGFNVSNSNNTFDSRSTSKGPEPEGISIGRIGDSTYAFICLERIGGVMMYNITNPYNVRYIDYLNARNFTVTPSTTTINATTNTVGDLGPEVVVFIPSSQHPSGQNLVVSANEISGTVSIYGIQNIAITQQPQNTVACAGEQVTFRVTATGAGLTYQWSKDGTVILGQTNPTLTLPGVTAESAGLFDCLITPTIGLSQPIRSSRALLNVAPSVSIDRQPQSVFTTIGSNAILTVEANAPQPVEYQWFRGFTGLTNNNRVSGARSQTLTIRNINAGDTASNYYCQIISRCGTILTRQVRVGVSAISFTSTPQNQSVCVGKNLVLEVQARVLNSNSRILYQWRKNGTAIAGATNPIYVKDTASQSDAGNYDAVVSLDGNPTAVIYGDIAVTVLSSPTISTQPIETLGVCASTPKQVQVTATGDNLLYQWYRAGNAIQGATQSSYSVQQAGTYYVIIRNQCSAEQSRLTTVTQLQLPQITQQPSRVSGLVEGNQFTLTVSAVGDGTLTYQWQKDGVDIPSATSPTYTKRAGFSDRGQYQCKVSNECGTTTSSLAFVDIISSIQEDVGGIARVYPSPASDYVIVEHNNNLSASYKVELVDALGRIVLSIPELHPKRVDVSSLSIGSYKVLVTVNNVTYQYPLMIVR
jgi:hypothetical protein